MKEYFPGSDKKPELLAYSTTRRKFLSPCASWGTCQYNKSFAVLFFVAMLLLSCTDKKAFIPGKTWLDVAGKPINAHGGGILRANGKYYWYGEIKSGKTFLPPGVNWECYRVDAGGVSCYSSENLYHWKYEGVALEPDRQNPLSDIHISRVIERPKVIFNSKTGKYVMWIHIDTADYSAARAGVAISDSPAGPYRYLGSFRPNGNMSRDMTLFLDDDGKAYHIYSSENNRTMHISLLTDDYLKPSGSENRIFIDQSREAPAMFKNSGKYYLITSACTGWSPNKAILASADSIMGKWKMLYNPCTGPDADSTYHAQSTFVMPINSKEGKFIFMADIWNKTDLENSKYLWLPLIVQNDSVIVKWKPGWRTEDLQ